MSDLTNANLIAALRKKAEFHHRFAGGKNETEILLTSAATALEQAGEELVVAKDHAGRWFVRLGDALNKIADRDATIDAVKARLQVPMHPYGDKRIPKMPEVQFARDAYGPDLFDDIDAILSGSAPTTEAVKLDSEPATVTFMGQPALNPKFGHVAKLPEKGEN